MKRLLIAVITASALGLTAVPAVAGPWIPINQRQAALDARIDQGAREGSLTRHEAASLRTEFARIARLETTYRQSHGVFSDWERLDLDQRLDALSLRIAKNRRDAERRGPSGWIFIRERQANLDERIDQGVRNGSLTPREAATLRQDFKRLVIVEEGYRYSSGVLDDWERADLNRRMDALSARIRANRHDAQQTHPKGGGWVSINDRQEALYDRIEHGVRNGRLTRAEADALRAEFRQIAGLEEQYRQTGGGLSDEERIGLDRRLDALTARIAKETHDAQRTYQ